MYKSIAKIRGKQVDDRVISLKRPEWQQPADVLPPLNKRLPGQRRRRILGSFPQTESDVCKSLSDWLNSSAFSKHKLDWWVT